MGAESLVTYAVFASQLASDASVGHCKLRDPKEVCRWLFRMDFCSNELSFDRPSSNDFKPRLLWQDLGAFLVHEHGSARKLGGNLNRHGHVLMVTSSPTRRELLTHAESASPRAG